MFLLTLRHKRTQELTSFQIKPVDLASGSHEEQISGRCMVLHVPTKLGYPESIIATSRTVELDKPITL